MNPKIFSLGLVLFLFMLVSCEERNQNEDKPDPDPTPEPEETSANLAQTDYLGCFNEYGFRKATTNSDTMYYEMSNDSLLLHVLMRQNCGACLEDSVVMRQDTANIYVADTCGRIANCICDFRFDYYFTDFGKQLYFKVYYQEYEAHEFNLWGELEYP